MTLQRPLMLVFMAIALGSSNVAEQRQPAGSENPAAAAATRRLADDVVAGIKRHTPEWGTYLGLPDAEHSRLTDNSLQARAKWRAQEDAWRERLTAIDGKTLEGHPEWVLHGSLAELLQTSIENRVCESELWSINQITGWQTFYGQLARMQPIETKPLQDLALARFRALSTFVDHDIVNLREGLRKGYAAPRGNVQQVITQIDGFVTDGSPYFSPAERTNVTAFATAWREMVRNELAPAFRRYRAFLRDEYLPRARDTVGVSALPNGAACYRARLRQQTTLSVTAAEVHKTGLEELEQIKTEQRSIAQRLFNNPDLDNAFAQLNRPEHKWNSREAVIAHARAALPRAKAAMPRWFGRLPKADVIVTSIPVAEERTARDRYWPGTIDGNESDAIGFCATDGLRSAGSPRRKPRWCLRHRGSPVRAQSGHNFLGQPGSQVALYCGESGRIMTSRPVSRNAPAVVWGPNPYQPATNQSNRPFPGFHSRAS